MSYRYSPTRPTYQIKTLIEVAAKVACHELGIALPDEINCVVPDQDGKLESRVQAGGWSYPSRDYSDIYVLIDRPPRAIVQTLYHELSHYAHGLKYNSIADALAHKEKSEELAHSFATTHTKDLPEHYSDLLAALQQRAFRQQYPSEHATAMVFAQRELARIDADVSLDDDFYEGIK